MDGSGDEDCGVRTTDEAGGNAEDCRPLDGHVAQHDGEVTVDH